MCIRDREYEARLQILMMHYGEKHEALFAVPPSDEEDILFAVLEKCRRENRVISLVVGDDMITGRVTEVNQLRLKLAALSFLGADAGMEQLTLREIDMVSIDSQEERMYETLEQLSGVPKLRVLRERAPGREEDHED